MADVFIDTTFFRFFGSEDEQRQHWQANAFAADILMPRSEIVKQIESGNNRIVTLAEAFGVTLLVMRWQLEHTGLIDRVEI